MPKWIAPSSIARCKKMCALALVGLRVGYMGWCWSAMSIRVLMCLREVCFPSYQTLPANDGSRLATRKRMCALVSVREVGGFSLFEKRVFSSFFPKEVRGERPLAGWLKTMVCSFSYCDTPIILYVGVYVSRLSTSFCWIVLDWK